MKTWKSIRRQRREKWWKYIRLNTRMNSDGIGYIRITEFDSVTYDQFASALEDLEAQGMTGLVIDLRDNPGGNLDTVCDILDLILPEGTIVLRKTRMEKEKLTHQMRNISWRFRCQC